MLSEKLHFQNPSFKNSFKIVPSKKYILELCSLKKYIFKIGFYKICSQTCFFETFQIAPSKITNIKLLLFSLKKHSLKNSSLKKAIFKYALPKNIFLKIDPSKCAFPKLLFEKNTFKNAPSRNTFQNFFTKLLHQKTNVETLLPKKMNSQKNIFSKLLRQKVYFRDFFQYSSLKNLF